MTSELIEQVARAICVADGAPIPEIRSWHRRYAQAAIEIASAEQAAELAKFKALAETLAGALEAIRSEAQREEGSWLHLKRCIAAQSAEALREYKEARDV